MRVDYHTGLASKQLSSPNETIEDGILGLDPDGFSLGGGPEVNRSGYRIPLGGLFHRPRWPGHGVLQWGRLVRIITFPEWGFSLKW